MRDCITPARENTTPRHSRRFSWLSTRHVLRTGCQGCQRGDQPNQTLVNAATSPAVCDGFFKCIDSNTSPTFTFLNGYLKLCLTPFSRRLRCFSHGRNPQPREDICSTLGHCFVHFCSAVYLFSNSLGENALFSVKKTISFTYLQLVNFPLNARFRPSRTRKLLSLYAGAS